MIQKLADISLDLGCQFCGSEQWGRS